MAHTITPIRTHTPAWRTRFTEVVGCDLPLQQTGMGWVAGPDLVAAVTKSAAWACWRCRWSPRQCWPGCWPPCAPARQGQVGVTFLMPSLDLDSVEVAARHARVVEFFYGDPDPMLVRRVRTVARSPAGRSGSVAEAPGGGRRRL